MQTFYCAVGKNLKLCGKNPINLFKLSVLAQPVNKTVVSVAAGV